MIVTVTLNAAIDRTLVVPSFQPGQRHRASVGFPSAGGKGINVARALKRLGAPVELVKEVKEQGRLPVVMFTAGGIATPADAALMMQLGSDGVFVGSGIFKSENPERMAKAIVQATTHFRDAKIIADVSRGLGSAMRGIELSTLPENELLASRGW